MKQKLIYLTVLAAVTTMGLTGCATPGGGYGAGPGALASHPMDSCRPGDAAVGGAVAGALLGLLAGGDGRSAARGAVAGAVVGALSCLAINAQSRRTMDAQAVEAEFRRAQGATVRPASPTLLAYETRVDSSRVRPQTPVRVQSNMKVLDGATQRVQRIEEHLVLLRPDGTEARRLPKEIALNASGGFDNDFTFQFPQAAQGLFQIRTELWVNGQKMDSNQTPIQLVMGEPMNPAFASL